MNGDVLEEEVPGDGVHAEPVPRDVVVVAASYEVHVMPRTGQQTAIVPTQGPGSENGDARRAHPSPSCGGLH